MYEKKNIQRKKTIGYVKRLYIDINTQGHMLQEHVSDLPSTSISGAEDGSEALVQMLKDKV